MNAHFAGRGPNGQFCVCCLFAVVLAFGQPAAGQTPDELFQRAQGNWCYHPYDNQPDRRMMIVMPGSPDESITETDSQEGPAQILEIVSIEARMIRFSGISRDDNTWIAFTGDIEFDATYETLRLFKRATFENRASGAKYQGTVIENHTRCRE